MDLDLTILAAGENAVSQFRSALLISLQVDFCVPAKDTLHAESQLVIAANELPVLCRILKKFDNLGNDGHDFLSNFNLVLRMFPSYQLGVDTFVNTGSPSRLSKSPHSLPHQTMKIIATIHLSWMS